MTAAWKLVGTTVRPTRYRLGDVEVRGKHGFGLNSAPVPGLSRDHTCRDPKMATTHARRTTRVTTPQATRMNRSCPGLVRCLKTGGQGLKLREGRRRSQAGVRFDAAQERGQYGVSTNILFDCARAIPHIQAVRQKEASSRREPDEFATRGQDSKIDQGIDATPHIGPFLNRHGDLQACSGRLGGVRCNAALQDKVSQGTGKGFSFGQMSFHKRTGSS